MKVCQRLYLTPSPRVRVSAGKYTKTSSQLYFIFYFICRSLVFNHHRRFVLSHFCFHNCGTSTYTHSLRLDSRTVGLRTQNPDKYRCRCHLAREFNVKRRCANGAEHIRRHRDNFVIFYFIFRTKSTIVSKKCQKKTNLILKFIKKMFHHLSHQKQYIRLAS